MTKQERYVAYAAAALTGLTGSGATFERTGMAGVAKLAHKIAAEMIGLETTDPLMKWLDDNLRD